MSEITNAKRTRCSWSAEERAVWMRVVTLTSDALASRIMRTTIDIDDPILKDLKRLQRREGKSLGRLVSDLLAQALATERRGSASPAPVFKWIARPMRARVDLADKHALLDAMDDTGR